MDNEELCRKITDALMPMVMDMSTVYLYSHTHTILEQVVGPEDSEVYQVKANTIIFEHLYTLLINYASSTSPCRSVLIYRIILVF